MPFRYSRKNYRRGRKLTKASIYGNRSAKAQSRQIATINRKVNYLAKRYKPEIHNIFKNYEHEFTNSTLATNYDTFYLDPYVGDYFGDDQIFENAEYSGNFNRCVGITLNLISQYSDNWRDTIADAQHDQNAGYRIAILQYKRATPTTSADTGINVFNAVNNLTSSDNNLTMPLITGITQSFKVLYSKVFTISRYHSTRQHRIHIPASKCLNFAKDIFSDGQSSNIPKGRVLVCILTGGLHADIDYTAQIKIAATLKINFTDN